MAKRGFRGKNTRLSMGAGVASDWGRPPTCKPVQLASSLVIFFAISPIANDVQKDPIDEINAVDVRMRWRK